MLILLCLAALSATAGALLAPHAMLAAPADGLARLLGDAMGGWVSLVADTVGWGAEPIALLVTALLSTAAPGMLCLTLAEASVAGKHMRRMAGALLVLSSLASFAVLAPAGAATLLLLAVPAAAVLTFVPGNFAAAPMAVAAGFLGARVVVQAVAHVRAHDGADAFDALLPLGGGWALVLAVAAAAPVMAALVRLTRR